MISFSVRTFKSDGSQTSKVQFSQALHTLAYVLVAACVHTHSVACGMVGDSRISAKDNVTHDLSRSGGMEWIPTKSWLVNRDAATGLARAD